MLLTKLSATRSNKPVKKRKLKWYGHVSRLSGLEKTLARSVRGGGDEEVDRRRGEKTTSEWTGMEFGDSQRENRETWKELVRKSSMVPQRYLRVMEKLSEEDIYIYIYIYTQSNLALLSRE